MRYKYEILTLEGSYGFNILCEDSVIITQEYKPDEDGYQPMTEQEAKDYAIIVIGRLEG